MKLIAIGDNVVDYYQNQNVLYPGGNAVNVAVAAKRIGAASSAYLGIIGNDEAAEHITNCLASENIELYRSRTVYGESGKATVSITEDGDRIFIGTNKGTRVQSLVKLSLTEQDIDYINQFDLVHMSVNSETEHELSRLAHKSISFDFSTSNRWNEEYLKQICPYIEFAFFSGSDLPLEDIDVLIEEVHQLGVKVVGVTRGEKPAVFSEEGRRVEHQPLQTTVIDTMGAGDSFIGTFLSVYYDHHNLITALYEAAKAAAKTCRCHGAFGYGIEEDFISQVSYTETVVPKILM
ncbi:PfkB family carbohydrate kinase [Domibacillus sp. DTU_2020_1001157_1_SI_ALB_TIR_016]|uniref:PfkB family carbohydrate kinase n=1 Tax=Domibacillus sp. DTU_2020_1001157_1_SI_ALB_TIR_016 TaxID=3077789 RepID=UPI0028EF7D90|nr:PfkB family carbohydrate kinase [Domibacillus sp. DTU_2020_1001157_1_SI_ALB_TIR_016]WNS78864.1 PfkB family carbohydrate kinase [Domibacillus sp. DTU_2020_1001157_1_SI_ALB_TIR_016]